MRMFIHIDFFNHFRFNKNENIKPYKLMVYKHSNPNFYKKKRIKKNDFELDIIELAYYTARTLCSFHVSERELYFDIISSLLSHFNFITKNVNDYLVISESRYKRLRDFSKSTRIGELAQAINALFISERLNFPYIIDFDLAKNILLTLNIQTKGKSPDFVVLNSNLTELGLFESKGSAGKTPNITGINGYLAKAMVQINDVKSPCFKYHIPSCTRFENNQNITNGTVDNSSINYALIVNDCTNHVNTNNLKKLHYTSWFYLVGDFNRVQNLLNKENITKILDKNDPIYELDQETDKGNPIFWVKNHFMENFISSFGEVSLHLTITSGYNPFNVFKIGIYKKVVDELSGNSKNEQPLPSENTNYLRRFKDGTVILMKNREE